MASAHTLSKSPCPEISKCLRTERGLVARWKQRGPCDFTYLRLESESKNLFSVTLFFQAPLILRAIRRPNRVMRFRPTYSSWKKTTGHNLRPQPIPSFSLAFGAAEKNMNFKNVVRNLNFKKSLRGYIGFRMGVPNVELDLSYIYPKYPPKTLNK